MWENGQNQDNGGGFAPSGGEDRQNYTAWESRYQKSSPDDRTPWEHDPRRRRRGSPSGLVILIISVAVVVGIAFLGRASLSGNRGNTGVFPALPSPTASAGGDTESGSGPTTVERAPVGDGTVLKIVDQRNQPMTIQNIYLQVIPSVVSIEAALSDSTSLGTGIVMSSNGYIITNYHVIEGSSAISVSLQDNTKYTALLVGSDELTDLAILKIDASGLTPATFGDSGALMVGDTVYAIGNPLGVELKGTLTDGIISAINRDVTVDGRTMTLLQTNAALNSGNSGGPLINIYGQIIGINTIKMMSYSSTVEGLGFAIPIRSAKPVVDELIERGYVSGRPSIGITASNLTEAAAAFYDTVQGVYVESVDTRSDAYHAGLRKGDVIVKINGKDVQTLDDVYAAKDGLQVGDSISVTVYRDEGYKDFSFRLIDAAVLSGEARDAS